MKSIDPKKKENFYRITVSDVILIIFILSVTTGAVLLAKQDMNRPLSNLPEASVFHAGKVIRQLRLDKDQEITILDGKMSIEIRGKKIRVKESNCPRQTCVHMGWIRFPGETIACIPYNILIEIKPSDSPVVDAVIY